MTMTPDCGALFRLLLSWLTSSQDAIFWILPPQPCSFSTWIFYSVFLTLRLLS